MNLTPKANTHSNFSKDIILCEYHCITAELRYISELRAQVVLLGFMSLKNEVIVFGTIFMVVLSPESFLMKCELGLWE